jgi:hypothetical protein
MEKTFSYMNNVPSQEPKHFFALVGRGHRQEFNRIKDYILNETNCRIFYNCVSDEYLRIMKADTGEIIPEAETKAEKVKEHKQKNVGKKP